VKDIHLINAALAIPFIKVLENKQIDVEKIARKTGLPIAAVRNGEGVIGGQSFWQFVDIAATIESCKHLGYDAAQQQPINISRVLGNLPIRLAPELRGVLDRFISDVKRQTSGTSYSLRSDGTSVWFRRVPQLAGTHVSWQAEQYVAAIVVQIVRLCADDSWLPKEFRFSSSDEPRSLPTEWESVDVSWGHSATEIRIPALLLAMRISDCNSGQTKDNTAFAQNLELAGLVDRQIRSNSVGLKPAAFELGVSPATLKRRLIAQGETYTSILRNRRTNMARDLLVNSTKPVREISDALGYKHPSNFTRAFLQNTGITPLQYRKSH